MLSPHVPAPLAVAALCSAVVASAATTVTAAAEKRTFNLPRGDAAVTLKQFAAAAGTPIVYLVDRVRGVTTNAVSGDLAPRDALDRMLAGSALEAGQDAATGALVVSRKRVAEVAPSQGEVGPVSDPQPKPKTNAMTSKPRTLLAALAGWFVASTAVDAQTVATPAAKEPLVLSPFVVETAAESGYLGRKTIAGNRINTNVTDFGASISIYTKEFLNDFGVTNTTQLFNYAANMEGGGIEGNYSGVASAENQSSFRENPQSQSRSRGIVGVNFTRSSFVSSIPTDAYNTGSITVSRGPNSILAGIGDPAGTVDTALAFANPRKNANKVEFRYGSEGSNRSVIDLNRVLVPDRLALRIAALRDEEFYNQKPAFETKKRLYGTATAKPFKSTTVRGSFETGNLAANRPLSTMPLDSVSNWIRDGKPVFDFRTFDNPAVNAAAASVNSGTFTAPPFVFAGQNLNPVTQVHDGRIAFIYANANAQTISNSFRISQATGNGLNQVRAGLFDPLVNRDSSADSLLRWIVSINQNVYPGSYYPGGVVPPGLKAQGFTNFDAFDYRRQMIDTTSRQGERFHVANLTLEQLFWQDRIGLELAYTKERFDRTNNIQGFNFSNNSYVRVDMSTYLPSGEPNPNVGRPLALFQIGNFGNVFTEREGKRATGFVRYDFKEVSKPLGRWLGDHTFTALLEENSRQTLNFNTTLKINSKLVTDENTAYFNRSPAVVVYLGDSLLPAGSNLRLNQVNVPGLTTAGFKANTTYYSAPVGTPATTQATRVTETSDIRNSLANATADRELIKSRAFVLQSNWLDKHLTTTVGWRRDEDYYYSSPTATDTVGSGGGISGGETDTVWGFNRFALPKNPAFRVGGEVKSYSAVLRWPKGLVKLPRGTDLSVFYNDSQNFSARAGSVFADRKPAPPPVGKTKEYGVNLWLLDQRLFLRVNHYETSVVGQQNGTGLYGALIGNTVIQTLGFWRADTSGVNRTADIALLESALPANIRSAWNYIPTGGFTQPSNLVDTSDLVAKGNEFELTFSPTKNWTIMANVAKQETVQSNILPNFRALLAGMDSALTTLANRPRGAYPDGYVPGSPLPPSAQTIGQFLDQAVRVPLATATATEGTVSAEQRKYRANAVVNYRFDSGSLLKGWTVGTALRWQDKVAIGYPIRNLPTGSTFVDVARPYFAKGDTSVDATISYGRKIWKDRIDWKVQFNARNLIAPHGAIATAAQPDGSIAWARIPPERRFYLNNSFSF